MSNNNTTNEQTNARESNSDRTQAKNYRPTLSFYHALGQKVSLDERHFQIISGQTVKSGCPNSKSASLTLRGS